MNVKSVTYAYERLWVRCYEWPEGRVCNPGRCWTNALYESIAVIWRWKQRWEGGV